ncbi:pyridoxamine 5'-phosphate oxidase [Fulvivirgaceae bacterium BMA12]|uniref:Pyridoxine/pyridoxamine 5'-phosphate oxidase n=1 Tax=Agaribacillus aureus TaxID=3051825 RepID=A0ABT8KYF9_9BACT|nr:pyridoxamine 5'-phosphate oxidase [Fulvivirgaceae bacterium BMA12]
MKSDLASIRNDYQQKSLSRQNVCGNPLDQFEQWFEEATEAEIIEPTAMNLSTVSSNGRPSARIVLLKGINDNAFQFYTNYDSQKGNDLAQNPFAALTFFWPELERQIRIEGKVEKLDAATSEDYFSTRPRDSKIGAWASPQSQVIESRVFLEENVKHLTEKYSGIEVPKPAHWGGYQLSPDKLEFWQGRSSRLHDRIVYRLTAPGQWQIERLAP